jgi:hypothetical protein
MFKKHLLMTCLLIFTTFHSLSSEECISPVAAGDLVYDILFSSPDFRSKFPKLEHLGKGALIPYTFETSGYIAADILQKMKIVGELKTHFPQIGNFHVLEIGGEGGDLCKVMKELVGFATFTICDDEERNEATKNDLLDADITNASFINSEDEWVNDYDLVIYHLDGLKTQKMNKEDLIKKLMNYPLGCVVGDFSHYSIDRMITLLRSKGMSGSVIPEGRLIDPNKKILIWRPENLPPKYKIKTKGCSSIKNNPLGNAVTFELSGGRLGDNLISYLHAKWLSFKYGFDLIMKDFAYSDQLCLSPSIPSGLPLKDVVYVNQYGEIDFSRKSTLFIVPYFPESRSEYHTQLNLHFPILWEDEDFKNEIKKVIRPKDERILADSFSSLPKDRPVVCVHVRTGIGHDFWRTEFSYFDIDYPQKIYHTKFPPLSYYSEQLKRISEMYNHQPLYVYLMTDSPNPEEIEHYLKQLTQKDNLTYLYRVKDNSPHTNVLEDFFRLAQCDCLIRGDSNFPVVASKIAHYKIMISPAHYRWENDKLVIDQVNIRFNP